ncbi:MAG: amino acid ABC transporter substrate-binding protein [Cyanobacteria bacterium]|nr:amino acid ABC transporter substrate-binding protein [Cyanobacteriota bacterium]
MTRFVFDFSGVRFPWPWRSPSRFATLRLAALALLLTGCANEAGSGVSSPHLATIRSRGTLICGSNGQLPGFSVIRPDGAYSGLDIDICRAVAAAVLGDPSKLEVRPLFTTDRFAALASGEVDLLSRNTTVTLSRDAPGGNALSFAPVVYFDGGGVMVPTASGIGDLKDLAGRTICVLSGTSTESVLADSLRSRQIPYTPLRFQTADQAFSAYGSGRCQAITSDRSGLAARRSRLPDPAANRILPDVLSKEPLAPATVQADPAWADAVRWIVYALIEAEDQGITQANVKEKLAEARSNPKLADRRRFLGVEGNLGSELGLPDDFVVKVITAVGNYGEIYKRNVGDGSPLDLPRGANRLARDGGLMISPPFR